MDLTDIKEKAEAFFDWPSEKRDSVTYTSAMLFAWHCLQDVKEDLTALRASYASQMESHKAHHRREEELCALLGVSREGLVGAVEHMVYLRQYVCQRCHGVGEITVFSGQTPESYQEENIACPDCVGSIIDRAETAETSLTTATEEVERLKVELATARQQGAEDMREAIRSELKSGRVIANFGHVPTVVRALEWALVDIAALPLTQEETE